MRFLRAQGRQSPRVRAVMGRVQCCQWCLSHCIVLVLSYLLLFLMAQSLSVCLSCSGVGVCTDNHNRGGDDGNGGGDHVSAEPLQTLCTILHQPAQPGQAARREPLLSKSRSALPATHARLSLALASSVSVIGGGRAF